jgi:hypothetical protein
MARTTVDATIKRIRRQLRSSNRHEINLLEVTVTSGATDLILIDALAPSIIPGAVISIGLEHMRVRAANTATRTVTVIRGWHDSTAAAHTAGDEVEINARYPKLDIYDSMLEEIASWGPQLYRVVGYQAVTTSAEETLELPSTFSTMYGIISCQRRFDSEFQDSTAWPSVDIRLQRGTTAWTASAPTSGLLVRFIDPMATGNVFFMIAMPYDPGEPALTADLHTDLFIPTSMLDVLAMGTKLRLAQDAEWGRSARQAQDDSRRSEETPVGAYVQPMQFGVATYRNRKQEEINKLRALYPIRVS